MVRENIVVNLIANVKGFNRALGTSMERFKEVRGKTVAWKKSMREANTAGGRLALNVRKMTHGMRGFRMEMLGVMFFGMGLQRFFTGLIRPALELVGVFKIFQTTLAILFLPIALKILDWALWFMDVVANMSEATKEWIGKMVLIGAALGIGLFLIGMFALGIGSLILMLSGLFNIIDKLIPDFEIAGLSMSGFVEAGLGIAIVAKFIGLLKKAWDKVKEVFEPIWDKFKEFPFIEDLAERFRQKIKDIKDEFKDLFPEADKTFDRFDDIKESLSGPEGLIGKFGQLFDRIEKNLPTISDLAEGLSNVADAVNRVMDALSPIFGGIKGGFMAAREFEAKYLGQTPVGGGTAAIAPFIPASPINVTTNVTINATAPFDYGAITDEINETNRTAIDNITRR